MKRTFQYFLTFCLGTACLLIAACVPEDPPQPSEPTEVFTCADGFEVSAADEECLCAAPKVRIGDMECRELDAREFYSDMEGCLTDIGMIFYFRDDSLINNCCKRIMIEYPRANIATPLFNFAFAHITPLSNGMDSIWFSTGSEHYFVPDPSGGEFPFETQFTGVFTDENTIVGEFQWGKTFDGRGTTQVSCPETFRRRVE
jgi:hypothetical protein